MRRHPQLHPLSRHHHFALVQALALRRAASAPPEQRADAARKTASEFLRFWKSTGGRHFEEEESVLLPVFARYAVIEADEAVEQLLADHAAIRAALDRMEAALEAGYSVERDVAWLGEKLQGHVRFEEDVLFPGIEHALGEAGLAELAGRLTRLHPLRGSTP
jgi:hemerythrin-like domain-containing protein